MSHVGATIEDFVRGDGSHLPLPGSGDTWTRFETLASWASVDLSLGRLAEGHGDALAILAEAGMKPVNDQAKYGVWAARSSQGGTSAVLLRDGWILNGNKAFCSGSGIIDRALIVVDTKEGTRVFDVEVERQVTYQHEDSWPAVGMADSRSATLEFGGPPISPDFAVGPTNFYTERPGFWFGSVGVAACWYGGALGLVESLLHSSGPHPNEHVLSEIGVAIVLIDSMRNQLHAVADEIDRDPRDHSRCAQFNALSVRQLVHDGALRVLNLVGTAGGARPLCLNREQSRRAADLFVYLSQHHGGSDAASIGRLAKEAWDAIDR